MRPTAVKLFAVASALGAGAAAFGHEFWIEPASFRPDVDTVLRLELRQGQRFRGELVRRDESAIQSFVVVGPGGEGPVVGRSGGAVSFARPESPGTAIIAYRSRRTPVELPASAFESYLKEHGLSSILSQRARLGESGEPGREVFSRCAKAIVCAGSSCEPVGHDRVIGLTLEVVPVVHPEGVIPGGELPVLLLYQGKPLAGALVVGVTRSDPDALDWHVTDGEGRAVFHPAAAGPWMCTATHMVRAPAGVDADWESFWASLAIEIPSPG